MNQTTKEISITKLHPFEYHPFQVNDNEEMEELMHSIENNGILTPPIVRPLAGTTDEYEIISGHRRIRAAERLGMNTIPVYVQELDKDAAVIAVVDSNLHRERLLPSEKAFAYKMKLDALKHQGKCTLDTSRQVVGKWETADFISNEDSGRQVQRYIRLTYLIPELLQLVDDDRIALTPAVALSYLKEQEQFDLLSAIEYCDCTPSLSQAVELKRQSFLGRLTKEKIYDLLSQEKANQKEKVKIPLERLQKYFPRHYTPEQIEDAIVKLYEAQYKKRIQNRDAR